MKTLTLVLLLCCGTGLLLSEAAAQSDPNGWGPGVPGECVTLRKEDVRFRVESFAVVGNSLYAMKRGTDCFVKILDLPFPVLGLDLIGLPSSGTLLFWSDQGVYQCGADGDSLVRIDAQGLLSAFLHHPIERASASQAYHYHGIDKIDHDVVDDATPSLLHEVRPDDDRPDVVRRINGINLDDLTWALREVNTDPWRAPSVADLDLDEENMRAFVERVAVDLTGSDQWEWDFLDHPILTPDNSDIYTDMSAILDTLTPEVVRAALIAHRIRYTSSAYYWYEVTLINAAGDTLFCSFESDGPTQPFALPWTLRYGDAEFQSYNVELARLLMKLLPENEYRTEREQKIDLLYAIADYLGEVRSRRGGSGVAAE